MVFALLAVIALGCIIWPLAALPWFTDSDPRAHYFRMEYMLIILIIGLLGLLVYFAFVLKEIHDLGRLRWFKKDEVRMTIGEGVVPTVTEL